MNEERESLSMSEENSMETSEASEKMDAVSVPKETPKSCPKEQPKRQPGTRALIGACLVISLGASLATIAGYDRWFAQKVVAVDIKGYIAQQRDNYLAGKLNDVELKKSFDRLEAVITAIPKNRVIIMGDAVVRNAETVAP
ncbi:conserved hypothetical membrane protein [Pelobacter propionicus DSM 2379]|uniref:Conserved hypothetical membrane protein n=2 Tax=Pelobacter propionicus TaxID=29543 RepID=A1AKL2_PELPD|nr:conserved hypothetical membrane protein [Pelobacter propionicus DSM 2379]